MAHPQQAEFFPRVRTLYPPHFERARVLEVGSLDINGSVRELFATATTPASTCSPGPASTSPARASCSSFPTGHFDTTISAECFEHNPFWRETLANMLRMTRPGGLVLISCATTGRKEHGTSRTNPDASPFTVQEKWDYYKNLTAADLERGVNLAGWLADWDSWINYVTYDLYFVGLRHGGAAGTLDPALARTLDARYAMTASAQALRRGLKHQAARRPASRPEAVSERAATAAGRC